LNLVRCRRPQAAGIFFIVSTFFGVAIEAKGRKTSRGTVGDCLAKPDYSQQYDKRGRGTDRHAARRGGN
jgi:hypothetical protein